MKDGVARVLGPSEPLNGPQRANPGGRTHRSPQQGGHQMRLDKIARRLAVLLAFGAASAAQAAGQFDGVTVNIMTFTGPQIAEPLQRRAPDFEKLTGAKINVITVPFSDLYTKLLTDWASSTNSVDAAVFAPQWMGDYAAAGLLEELSGRVARDKALGWDGIAPFFRDFSAKFNEKTYLIPLDGDFHMIYYRTDVFEKNGLKPPATWDDYLANAKALNGKDFGDGKPDYGSCISKKRNAQAYWFITSIAGAYIQSKGTNQGAFFDTRDMKPLIDNEGFRKALDFYAETTKYGPPNEINLDVGDTQPVHRRALCAIDRLGRYRPARCRSEDLESPGQGRIRHLAGCVGCYQRRH